MHYLLVFCLFIEVVSAELICSSNTSLANITCECFGNTNVKIDLYNIEGFDLNILESESLVGFIGNGTCCNDTYDTNCTLSNTNSTTFDGNITCNNVSLTLFVNNVKENMELQFVSVDDDLIATTNISLQGCESYCNLSGCISNGGYNTSSNFSCVQNTSLFVDGMNVTTSSLTCDVCGSWVGNGECWYALLDIDPDYIESVLANMSCLLKGNSTVHETEAEYFLDGKVVDNTIVMNSSFNNQTVCCSLNVSNTTLQSSISTLTVYWIQDVAVVVENSSNAVNTSNGVLVKADTDVTLYCLSHANPDPSCYFEINNTHINQLSCAFNQTFNDSSNMTCTAKNVAGSQTSSTVMVEVVKPRTSSINEPDGVTKKGNDITLTCNVPYAIDLETTFLWETPLRQSISNNSALSLHNLTRFDMGNYTCHTSDLFENTTANLFLNVTYGPELITQNTACNWTDMQNGGCFVEFSSNPLTENYTLTENGNTISCPKCIFQQHNSTVQRFALLLQQSDGDTIYTLQIFSTSTDFPHPLTVSFNVSRDEIPQSPGGSNQTVVIAASVSAVIVAIAIVVVAVIVFKRKPKPIQPASDCDDRNNVGNVYVTNEAHHDQDSFCSDESADDQINSANNASPQIYVNDPKCFGMEPGKTKDSCETTTIGKKLPSYENWG